MIKFLNSDFLIRKITFLLNNIISFYGKDKSYHIILSFGEIDIRGFFYRVLKFKKSSNKLKILLNKYSNKIPLKIEQIKKNLNQKTLVKYYFIEPPPTTFFTGKLPESKKEINEIYSNQDYPVLGKILDRVFWRLNLIRIISKKNDSYKFLKIPKGCFDKNNFLKKKISDGIHINSKKLILEIQKKLIFSNRL